MRQQFDLNKFQHNMIERLERLRGLSGLRTDKALRLGIGEGWTDDAEDKLRFGFRLLRAAETMSLAICCTTVPQAKTEPLHTRVGGQTLQLTFHRGDDDVLRAKPWPFAADEIKDAVPYRAVPARAYESEAELKDNLSASDEREMVVVVRP